MLKHGILGLALLATVSLTTPSPAQAQGNCQECNSITGICEQAFGRGFVTCIPFGEDNCVAWNLCGVSVRDAFSVDGTFLAAAVEEVDGDAGVYGVSCNGNIVSRTYTEARAGEIREASHELIL